MIAPWSLLAVMLAAPVRGDPDAVERAVREVLSDPAYAEGLSARSGTMDEIVHWLGSAVPRLIQWLLQKAADLHEAAPALFWLTFAGLCLLFCILVLHIGWTLSVAFRRAPGSVAPIAEADRDRVRRSSEILEESRRMARAGMIREGLRGLLLAVLALVEERKILRIARGWTHREIATRLRVPDPLKGDLRELQSTIEGVWYGSASATPDDFKRCEEATRRLAAGLVQGGTPEVWA